MEEEDLEEEPSENVGEPIEEEDLKEDPNKAEKDLVEEEEVEDTSNIVTGNFSIQTHPIEVLFDSDATHSFISVRLVDTLGLVSTSKHSPPPTTFLNVKVVSCVRIYS